MFAPAASWWGYKDADTTLVAILVAVVVVAALAYVVRRLWRR
jgi:hypothetical protein